MMKLKYNGEEKLSLKYQGKSFPVENGTEVDVDDKTAKELSERKVGGVKQWIEAGQKAPKKVKKGVE